MRLNFYFLTNLCEKIVIKMYIFVNSRLFFNSKNQMQQLFDELLSDQSRYLEKGN